MKLNTNHLLIFAFAIAAGLYIWNDRYSGKKDAFYVKKEHEPLFIGGIISIIVGFLMSVSSFLQDMGRFFLPGVTALVLGIFVVAITTTIK